MKKKMMLLLLGLVLSAGSTGNVQILAGETTGQEAEPFRESDTTEQEEEPVQEKAPTEEANTENTAEEAGEGSQTFTRGGKQDRIKQQVR